MNQLSKSVGAGNPHATFCGNRGRATASGDPVGGVARLPPIPIWYITASFHCRAILHRVNWTSLSQSKISPRRWGAGRSGRARRRRAPASGRRHRVVLALKTMEMFARYNGTDAARDTQTRCDQTERPAGEPPGASSIQVSRESLQQAKHDRADKGERNIGGDDAQPADEKTHSHRKRSQRLRLPTQNA